MLCLSETRPGLRRKSFWLAFLFVIQPCLDVLAFWTRNETATPAGYIRLVILILLPVYILATTKHKKQFFFFLLGTGIYCVLHILNSYRCGYISPVTDIRYLASVVQMPIFACCLILLMENENCKEAAVTGVAAAAVLTLAFLVVSRITNTGNVTYGEGLGYSGWVIDENRNANSTNFVFYGCFCIMLAIHSERKWVILLVPSVITAVFLTNGTKGCYFSVFAIFLSYVSFLLFEKYYQGHQLRKVAVIVLVLLSVFSAAVYRWTPRYQVTLAQQATARGTQGEIEATLLEKGIDITGMSAQDRFNNPEVKEVFEHYYWKYLGVKPDLIDRFGMDRVLMQYHMSTDVAKLIDARVMERNYADMVFQDSDSLTKILGFEVSQMGPNGYDGSYDLENDWHALFYYYGYLGFALYVCFVLYFLILYIKMIPSGLRKSFDLECFGCLLTVILMIGLAHFSGATLRRPNVSVWLSLILAYIHYLTEEHSHEAQCHCTSL